MTGGLPLAIRKPNADAALEFIRTQLGSRLWSKQEEIVRSVFGPHRVTAVRSGHSIGKTKTAADIVLAWLFTGPYRTVITTAPTWRQVTELLWKEIRRSYNGVEAVAGKPLGGRMPPSDAVLRIEEGWLAIGFSSDNSVNVQGWHCAGGTLVVLDEAPGVDPGIWEALQGVMVGENDRMLALGNPTFRGGPFFDLFQHPERHDASCVHVSCYDTPNAISGKELVPGLATKQWIESREKAWGKASPMFQSRVLGDFPDESDTNLIPWTWVDAAIKRHHALTDAGAWQGPYWMGVDIARYGENSSVAACANRQGVRTLEVLPRLPIPQTAGWIVQAAKDTKRAIAQVRVDADGLGVGVFDLVQAAHVEAEGMRGGMPASDPSQFFNRRSEWFWNLREMLDPHGPNPIALPDNPKLREQLVGIQWQLTPKGQRRIEGKDEMRARGLVSPDEADAVAYALSGAAGVGQASQPVVPLVLPDAGTNEWRF